MLKAPVPTKSSKLGSYESVQYLDGWSRRNSGYWKQPMTCVSDEAKFS